MVEAGLLAGVGTGIKIIEGVVDETEKIKVGIESRKKDKLINLEAMYGRMEGAFGSLNKHLEMHGVASIKAMPSEIEEYMDGLKASLRHTSIWWTRNSGKILSKADCKRIERVSDRARRACTICNNTPAAKCAARVEACIRFRSMAFAFRASSDARISATGSRVVATGS